MWFFVYKDCTKYRREDCGAKKIIKKWLVLLLCIFTSTKLRIPLHNTFLNSKEKFTWEKYFFLIYFFKLYKIIRFRPSNFKFWFNVDATWDYYVNSFFKMTLPNMQNSFPEIWFTARVWCLSLRELQLILKSYLERMLRIHI